LIKILELQTKIPLQVQQYNQIDYHSNIFLMGSCFVENMGDKLDYFKFQNTYNPFGILFHPKAIEAFITNAINEKKYSEKDVFFHDESWHCFEAHSKLSNPSKDILLEELNKQTRSTTHQLSTATHVVITLGTSWVYRFIEDDKIVANCHKVPQKQFLKELLSVDEVVNSLQAILVLLKQVNPKVSIIFTVSPIRHIKDGFVENNLSKSHLISGIHEVINERENTYYFPSYEIMMDELRDYRFYAKDMTHPSEMAINYIWEKFQQVWISQKVAPTMSEVKYIQKGLLHKPFHPNAKQHHIFLEKLKAKQEKLASQFPHITF
jgi:lysophospholipase L1-like esterase